MSFVDALRHGILLIEEFYVEARATQRSLVEK
jgi:hypothetical protein